MRIKPGTWLLISLLLFATAAIFWRLGENERLRGTGAGQGTPAPAATPPPAPTPSPSAQPAALLSPAGPKTPLPSEKKLYPHRLSNTSQGIKQLARKDTGLLLNNALIDTGVRRPVPIPEHLRAKGDPGSYIVQSHGFIDGAFLNQLRQAGAAIISYLPNNAYLVKLDAAGAQRLAAMGRVQAVLPWEPYYKIEGALLKYAVEQTPLPAGRRLRLTALPGERDAMLAAVRALGARVLGEDRSPFGPQLIVLPPVDALASLAQLAAVQAVERYSDPVPMNDKARVRVGVSTNSSTADNYLGLTGTNVLVAVVDDSGMDVNHPDLTTNRAFVGYGSSSNDPGGHATFVAGIIAGSGANGPSSADVIGSDDGANYRGVAPKASVLSFNLFTTTNYAGSAAGFSPDRSFDGTAGNTISYSLLQELAAISNLFTFARTNTTLISHNSWGEDGSFGYNSGSASYDMAVRDSVPGLPGSQPVVYVFSAGNSGLGGNSGQGGLADTIQPLASAKNVITVGAIESERDSEAGSDPGKTRGITNIITRTNFITCGVPDTVTRLAEWQALTDSSNEVASFSSRGNVGVLQEGPFGRFKPDLVAPGTFTVSLRSTNFVDPWDSPTTITNLTSDFTIQAGATNQFAVFVENNATNLTLSVVSASFIPPFNLLIYTNQSPNPSLTAGNYAGANSFSMPVDCSLAGGVLNYDIVNTNTVAIDYTVAIVQTVTNDNGDYYIVLSNLNHGNLPPFSPPGLGPDYRYDVSGTSFSAPVVSGLLALMQEFFEQTLAVNLRRTNSPAMMKALLINGARSVSGNYGLQVTNFLNLQGWGLPNLQTVIPAILSTETNATLWPVQFFDQSESNALATGEQHLRNIQVNGAPTNAPLRVTLVWTDPPGNPNAAVKLVNDLNLIVSNNVSGQVYFGNAFPGGGDYSIYTGVTNITLDTTNVLFSPADFVNNVENVYINGPLDDRYTVFVQGYRVNVNAVPERTNSIAQDYALVISTGSNFVSGALTVDQTPAKITNSAPLVVILDGATNQVLSGQRVGANAPLITTTNGTTNQWTFYVITNSGAGTNGIFATFLPPNASRPRNATADIDLFVSTSSGLTNLDDTVIANCFAGTGFNGASTNRGGTEIVKFTNNAAGTTYYVGVKSEDQQSADFNFFTAFTDSSLARQNPDGSVDVFPFSIPAGGQEIPDGSPDAPGVTNVLAFNDIPITIRRIVVTNYTLFHENFGDLVTLLSHEGVEAMLQNHSYPLNLPPPDIGGLVTIVYDDSEEGDIAGSQPTDGVPNLQQFNGQEGLGMWILTAQDNQLDHTGRVDALTIHIDPTSTNTTAGGSAGGSTGTNRLAAGRTYYTAINVPVDAVTLTLTVSIVSGTGPMDLYVRRGAPPDLTAPETYDHYALISNPGGTLTITRGSLPPLSAGTYYIAIRNNSGGAVDFVLAWEFEFDAAATAPLAYVNTSTTLVMDNALTNTWSSRIPVGLVITASVTNKALTSNAATLTTAGPHRFAVGDRVQISGVGTTGTGVSYNGTFTVTSVPTSDTFTYALVAADDPSTTVFPAGQALRRDEDFTFSASVTNKALTSFIATLITDGPHNFAVGDRVTVSLNPADASFDGTYTVYSVPSADSLTYIRNAVDVSSQSTAGTVSIANGSREVTGVQVGVRIQHERAADLVLHLVAPSGKRVLLAENRGYLGTNGYGMGTNVNELAYATFTDDTNIAPYPIKFATAPAFLDFIAPTATSTNYLTDTNWTVGTGVSSGGLEESRILIPTGTNEGQITVTWQFYIAPDRIQVNYEGANIYDTGWTNNQASSLQFLPADVEVASGTITNIGHGLTDGTFVVLVNPFLSTSDTPPAPLQTSSGYYVVNATANTFQLEDFPGSGAIPFTSAGTGTNTLYYGANVGSRSFTVAYGSGTSTSQVVELVVNEGTNPSAGTAWDYTFQLRDSSGAAYTYIGSNSLQRAASVAISGSDLYLAGTTDAYATNGIAARFALPLTSNSVPAYSFDWPTLSGTTPRGGTRFHGIAVSTEGVYAAGSSYTQTTDTNGTKETKGIVVKVPLTDPSINATGPQGSVYHVQVPASPSASGAFTNAGNEELLATTVATESGVEYVYVTGYGQENSTNAGRLFLSKLDTFGTILWTVNDATPGITNYSSGRGVSAYNGNVYVAGVTNDGADSYTYLASYDSAGTLNWVQTNGVGQYNGVIVFEGAIYAVGSTNATSGATADFLIDRWDLTGTLIWSKTYDYQGDEDILNAVVGYADRLYAVGSARSSGADSDVAILEIDQATGDRINHPSTDPTYSNGLKLTDAGQSQDDAAYGVATDGFDLYVVGEGRRYPSVTRTDSDVMLLRYRIKNDYQPEEPLTSLIGEQANGNWQLEIWDNREGGTNTTAQLLGWQLRLNLTSTNGAAYRLENGVVITNTLSNNDVAYFLIDAPFAATLATHNLTNLATTGSGSMTLSFDQYNLPSDALATTYTILTTTAGSTTLSSYNTTPSFVPGQRYYLAVRNTNPNETNTFTLKVEFDNTATTFATRSTPVSGTQPPPNTANNLYQFTVDPSETSVAFQVIDLNGNVAVHLRRGALPAGTNYDLGTNLSTTNFAQLLIEANADMPSIGGTWYASVENLGPGGATYDLLIASVNHAPTLSAIANQTVDEGATLNLPVSGTDPDAADILTYGLDVAPAGATIDSATGAFSFTPTEAQGPGSFEVAVRVMDNGSPQLSATASFTITVNEVNSAPVLAAPANQTINELTTLNVSALATDSDDPPNALTFSLVSPPAGMGINANTGLITWTPAEAQGPNVYTVTVSVADNGTPALSDTKSFTVTVNEVNSAPALTVPANQTIDELTTLNVTATAADADLPVNTLTFSLVSGPAGLSINANTGAITWTPTEVQGPGVYTVMVKVTDNGPGNLNDAKSFTVTVNEVNSAPVLTVPADQTINELATLNVTATASDPDQPANTPAFSLVSGPAGLSIDASTGVITWTPTEAQGPSTNTVTVKVTDNGTPALNDTKSFTVVVNEANTAPVLTVPANQTLDEVTSLSVSASATDADTPANTLTFSLVSPLAGMTINANTGVITWTPTEAQGPSVNTVTVKVTDDGSSPLSDTKSFTVTVNEVNRAPVLTVPDDQTVAELATLTVTNLASDADLPANTLTFVLVSAPEGASLNATNGVLTWTPSESQGGATSVIEVSVTDDGSPPLSVTNSFTVVVEEVNSAPVLTVPADQTLDELTPLNVAAAATDSDDPPNALTFSLESAPAGMTINASTGAIMWTPTEAQGPAVYTVTVKVTDNGTPVLSDTKSFSVTVGEVNSAPVLTVPADQTLDELTPLNVTATATDSDLPANTLTFSLVSAPTGMTIDASTGVIAWTPTEAQGPSVNTVTVKVTDNGSPALSDTKSFTVTVNEVNGAPVLTAPADQTLDELTPLSVSASAADSDTPANALTFSLVSPPAGMTINANTGAITWTPTEAQGPGTNTVTVKVTDNGSPALNDTKSFTVTVNEANTAPVLTVPANQTIDELTTLSVSASATDADQPANTLTYTLIFAPTGMTINANTGAIAWTPAEDQGPGVHTVTVKVADDGSPALSDTKSFTVTVNEVNAAPVFATILDQEMNECDTLQLLIVATDNDTPANEVSYSLVAGAPAGAGIDPVSGLFTFIDPVGPSTNIIQVIATDNGTPSLSTTQAFTVTVNELATNVVTLVAGDGASGTVTVCNQFKNFYKFTVAGGTTRILFELYGLSGNADLLLKHGAFPTDTVFDFAGANPGTQDEQIVVSTNASWPDISGDWYLAVSNREGAPITFSIRANVPVVVEGGTILTANSIALAPAPVVTGDATPQITWSTVVGEKYQVEVSTDLINWTVLTSIVVSGPNSTFTDPTPYTDQQQRFYRIRQVPQ